MRIKPLIFIIDDDPVIHKLVEAELKSDKLDVMSFSYGEDSLVELFREPDLIILDYCFVNRSKPVLGGMDILKEIRKTEPVIPVIILSGQESGGVVLELIRMGIEEYVIKENNWLARLKEAVNSILHDN